MFRYYNNHPRKLFVDDCTKRSISLATGIPYMDVQKGMNQHKKVTGVKRFYNNPNPRSYMENVLGYKRVRLPQRSDGTHITVEEFARSNPQGRFVVSIPEHWTACIDGVIYDTWDCSQEIVLSYYKVTHFTKTRIEKKYCFTVKDGQDGCILVTVYDGLGSHATKQLRPVEANAYADSLYGRGFFNYDEMGEYKSSPILL